MKSRERTVELLERYGLQAKISFGQNFLVDDRAIELLVGRILSTPAERIIEIGCGLGSLTAKLVSCGTPIVGYELDRDLFAVLQQEIKSPQLTLLNQDFLRAELGDIGAIPTTIIGNIPYNITKKILLMISGLPLCGWGLMVQQEVADKLFFKAGSWSNTAIGAYLALNGRLERVIDLGPASFYPSPKVASTFVFYTPTSSHAEWLKPLERLYSAKNKVLKNSFKGTPKPVFDELLSILGDPLTRVHQLSLEQLRQIVELPLF